MKKTAGKETPSKVTTAKEATKEAPKEKAKAKPVAVEEAPSSASARARMTKPELKFFENLLNEKKETLIQELGYLEDNTMRLNSKEGAGDLSSHAYHLADHATETQDREQAFHMASREGKYLFYIEEALDRVRNGSFGVCKKCGKLIPKARLEAVPTAKMCIDCKTKQERAAEAASAG
jgi:RNA polymerase-binding protein DksA